MKRNSQPLNVTPLLDYTIPELKVDNTRSIIDQLGINDFNFAGIKH